MARMFPKSIAPGTTSKAERQLFRQFQEQLPDEFTVLHSVAWTRRRRNRRDSDGEADFVILHPTLGLLVIEVKGGQITVDGSTGQWNSTDTRGHVHNIKNPFDQARNSMHSVVGLIRESPATQGASFAFTYGAAFPSVRIDDHPFGAGIDPTMWMGSSDLNAIEAAVRRMYGSPGNQLKLNQSDIAAIVDLIRPTRQIHRLGLAAEMLEGEEEVVELTERQYDLLHFMQSQRRARIEGCAGSGKTMLAIEKARRLAMQGFDVLLTCYNKGLSGWLQQRMRIDGRPEFERVTVQHYHDLAMTMCNAAGTPQTVPSGVDASGFWEWDLPQAFMDAIARLPDRRYDAIVVDEGQDFATEWWITLEELLRDPEVGVFYIFHDDNQRIYHRSGEMPVPNAPYSLDTNCRNTMRIHEAVMDYYQDTPKPRAGGPPGRQMQVVPRGPSDSETLRGVVADLVDGEGLKPDNMVVLTPKSRSRSSLKEGMKLGNRSLTWEDDASGAAIRVSTIHAFKGLERDVVILAEADELTRKREERDMLCYVGLSRAKHHIVVIGALPEPALAAGETVVNQ